MVVLVDVVLVDVVLVDVVLVDVVVSLGCYRVNKQYAIKFAYNITY
jgi:hypothetical protein